ncbi:NAD(P)/FAD-dependent oxidoreductase, partial [Enterocloster asparagiformis]|uniref:NAD(P)/FAD-dependent oxidoreductase n=1 Tax=Enterocloster asparagiformis TaxID=333367 RepID=UPI0033193DEF
MREMNFDAVIIGGGVVGCAIARELSRYDLRACVVEREEDVCSGTSKANSAIVHAGHDAVPGSLKARFNVEGNRMMEELAGELDFDFKRNGSLVLCFDEKEKPGLEELYEKGCQNGVPGLSIISGDQAREMEPNVSDSVVAALYAPSGGIVCPFGLTIALAENACDNGVEFRFLTEVKGIRRAAGGYELETENRRNGERAVMTAKYVVNAAGVYADAFHNMVSAGKIHITARKGEYCLLDKEAGGHVSHTIFQLPGKMGKGVLVTPTVHGNLLTGPTATDVEDKEAVDTTAKGLGEVMSKAVIGVKDVPFRLVITSFAGLRAHEDSDDFVIGEAADAPGFFDAAGIESPGLTSAPAIGRYVAELVAEKSGALPKAGWNGRRTGIVRPNELDKEARAALIRENPAYGTIVCRCESVSEG